MKYLLLIVLFVAASFKGFSQDHTIAYTTIELILNYMPETKQIETEVATYSQQLQKELAEMEQVGQVIIAKYTQLQQNGGSKAELAIYEDLSSARLRRLERLIPLIKDILEEPD